MTKMRVPILILVLGLVPRAFGQTLFPLNPQSPSAALEAAWENKDGLVDQAALQRTKRILSFGGAVKATTRPSSTNGSPSSWPKVSWAGLRRPKSG
ncbi:MAG: hypothetical protein ACHQ2Z_15395 [Elusimicrobiota bacterium]